MNAQYLKISESLNGVKAVDRGCVTSIAAGMAAASLAAVPTSPVENVQEYYNLQALPAIRAFIGEANEALVMEFEEACTYALMFWRMRYFATHPATRIDIPSPYGFFDTVLGAHLFVDQDTHSFVNVYPRQIFRVRDDLRQIFELSLGA